MSKYVKLKLRDTEEARKAHAYIRKLIAKDPDLAGRMRVFIDIQEEGRADICTVLPDDVAVSDLALAPLVAKYGDSVEADDVDRVRKWTLREIYLIADREGDLGGFQEVFEQNKDLFDHAGDLHEKSIPVFVYSVATDKAVKFYPDCRFTEKHVPLLKKLFGEGRVYEYTSPAEYVFNWTGSTVPKEVREYGREGFNKDWFEVPEDERSEAENSLIAERLHRSLSLLADDMSKVNYIKSLTSGGLSDAAAVLFLIWKELHAMNARMDG